MGRTDLEDPDTNARCPEGIAEWLGRKRNSLLTALVVVVVFCILFPDLAQKLVLWILKLFGLSGRVLKFFLRPLKVVERFLFKPFVLPFTIMGFVGSIVYGCYVNARATCLVLMVILVLVVIKVLQSTIYFDRHRFNDEDELVARPWDGTYPGITITEDGHRYFDVLMRLRHTRLEQPLES
eukprot:gnl/TRDRNA2_/TRDRNA2_152465_c0_seq7.p1 gnl/TRDRNA2_/TRDRNA2_152465_c0~~gnl/TRDRNA2_/TRDRNA2_152465_c0_seq7.p1  ORF type:complete len:191 (+),score=26.21 gnl/TRDRNA2_/TRDRNA2_152465_c0_seq7:31-573(+)